MKELALQLSLLLQLLVCVCVCVCARAHVCIWHHQGKALEKKIFRLPFDTYRTSLVAQMVKNLSAEQQTWVQSLGGEDPCRREWQPNPVFLPGESYGQRSLAGYSPRGRKESDTAERLTLDTYS